MGVEDRSFNEYSSFHYADYIVLSLMLGISMAIGIYYAYIARKKNSQKEYFTASGSMGIFPTTLSLVASVLCSIWYIGIPAEVYSYGIHWIYDLVMVVFSIAFASWAFLPVFYEVKLTSANQYLEVRFNRVIRIFGATLYLLNTLLYVSLVMFLPALSISQVTGLHLWISISVMCVVGTIYTAIGGIRAVMWTDVFQMIVIYASMIAILVKGTMDVGGIDVVIERNIEGKRIAPISSSADPRLRYNIYSILVSCVLYWAQVYGVSQTQVQRYASCPSLANARKALWWNIPSFWFVEIIIFYIGLVIYAKYWDCDPLESGKISTYDEILTFYVIEVFGEIPGLPGLFVSGVFSGALSTISSALNSMAAVMMEDIVKSIPKFQHMSETTATTASRWTAIFFGVLTIIVMILIEKVESIIAFTAYNLGAVGGCNFALFCLGLFCPWGNTMGASIGLMVSFTVGVIFAIGGQTSGVIFPTEVMSIGGCINNRTNVTQNTESQIVYSFNSNTEIPFVPPVQEDEGILEIFKISPYNMGILTFVVGMVVGMIASLFTGCRKSHLSSVDRKLLSPMVRRFLRKEDEPATYEKNRLTPADINQPESFSLDEIRKMIPPSTPYDTQKADGLSYRPQHTPIDSYPQHDGMTRKSSNMNNSSNVDFSATLKNTNNPWQNFSNPYHQIDDDLQPNDPMQELIRFSNDYHPSNYGRPQHQQATFQTAPSFTPHRNIETHPNIRQNYSHNY